MSASPRSRPAIPATTRACRSRTASCRRCCTPQGYATFAIGKWHLTPAEDEHAGRAVQPLAARSRASSASTASSAARPTSGSPSSCYDNHPSSRRADARGGLPPQRGPRRPGDPVHHRRARQRARQAVLPLLRLGAGTRRTTSRREWIEKYRGKFDRAGTVRRDRLRAAEGDGHRRRPARSCRRDPDVPAWDSAAARTSSGSTRGMMEVYAGFLEHDRPPHRAHHRLPRRASASSTTRSIMVISDNGASAEGGAHGSFNEKQLRQPRRGDDRGEPRAHRRARAARRPTHYSWGWAWAGNTPFRRWKRDVYQGGMHRPAHRALAGRHRRARRGARPVRARRRHDADRPRRCSASSRRRRSTASSRRRSRASSFAHTLRRRRRRRRTTPRSTSRCSATGRSTTTAGARSAAGRGRASPKAPREVGSSSTRSPPRSWRSSTREEWMLFDVATDPAESHDVAERAPREAARADRALVDRGREVPRTAAGLGTFLQRGAVERPHATKPTGSSTSTTRASRSCRRSTHRRSSTGHTASPPSLRSPRAEPKGSSRPGRLHRRLRALRPGRPAVTTSTTTSAQALFEVVSDQPLPAGAGHRALRVRGHDAAEDPRGSRRRRARRSSTSTARSSPTPRSRTRRRSIFGLEGLLLRLRRRRRGGADLQVALHLHRHHPQGHRRPRPRADPRRRPPQRPLRGARRCAARARIGERRRDRARLASCEGR